MPIASVSTESRRFDLKSVAGGFVELRPLSYGQVLKKREIATEQAVKGADGDNAEMGITMAHRAASRYEFSKCITDHNLQRFIPADDPTDEGKIEPFDFVKDPNAIDYLDPKTGEEIDRLIEGLNQFDNSEADGSGN